MADIDDELLALAGDDSSGDEQVASNDGRHSSSSPDRNGNMKSSAKKGGKKGGRRNDDSEEEGEASSGDESVRSERSAPMDESDSDSDGPGFRDDADRYPLEGRFMNASDKATIMSMPEIEREQVLADRAQEIERDRQNRVLRQLLNGRDAADKKAEKKRKAGTADLDDNQRKTSRQRTKLGGGKVGEASTGIDSLKRARAEKNDRQRRREEDKERRGGDSRRDNRDDYSDDGSDEDSEVEWTASKSKKRSASPDYRDAEPAVLYDLERVRVGRSRFAMVCFYPGFDDAITGCFVRVNIGVDKETNQNLYRMGLVKGFKEDRPYAMMSANGKQFSTTQYVIAAHGKSERSWPFIACSDSRFTEAEWQRYKQNCIADGIPVPTKPKLMQKCAEINALVNRPWTEEELQTKLKKSSVLTERWTTAERARLNNAIKEQKSLGNTELEEKYRSELEALESAKLAYGTTLKPTPKKKTVHAQQDRLAELNRTNRRKNIEEVRQAQINERRAARLAEAAIARGEIVDEDHSRRVKTRATFKHDHTGGKDSATATPVSGTSTNNTPKLAAKKDALPVPNFSRLQTTSKGGVPGFRRPLMDDDIIASIDIGISDDLEL
ncbi:putative rna polymerase 2 transcription elongation factor protein [Botrytis fragariae]|uniref:Putative rna polymerase 2 transcription elongation factor protein n=1 Tax=Botrytis fragariae TaxID=1964551 RepID=A0A8H6ELZ1_9HELO|nr:putative rna polymerase 2 transcription elongation factor protein [Botrytis fragariae]KAF5877034.1 putative rna polymerase 2 transcription elongation factor protein [Botrytis fragariae]